MPVPRSEYREVVEALDNEKFFFLFPKIIKHIDVSLVHIATRLKNEPERFWHNMLTIIKHQLLSNSDIKFLFTQITLSENAINSVMNLSQSDIDKIMKYMKDNEI